MRPSCLLEKKEIELFRGVLHRRMLVLKVRHFVAAHVERILPDCGSDTEAGDNEMKMRNELTSSLTWVEKFNLPMRPPTGTRLPCHSLAVSSVIL
jgi:hypothetical protein